jgi:hypothetical protein
MRPHNDLLVGKLVIATDVVTLESDLLQSLLLEFAERLKNTNAALARSLEVL